MTGLKTLHPMGAKVHLVCFETAREPSGHERQPKARSAGAVGSTSGREAADLRANPERGT